MWFSNPPIEIFTEKRVMKMSSRLWVRALAAAALAVSVGGGAVVAQPAVIIERGVMPPLRVEVIPRSPGAGYNWVPGHWAWRGNSWAWIGGHHIRGEVPVMPVEIVEVQPARPSPGHVWIKGHHVFEGTRWVWHPGVWARF
jgi:hypothetical protein